MFVPPAKLGANWINGGAQAHGLARFVKRRADANPKISDRGPLTARVVQ
jgi:hypothetical protein